LLPKWGFLAQSCRKLEMFFDGVGRVEIPMTPEATRDRTK
jgi:hypothetical protein